MSSSLSENQVLALLNLIYGYRAHMEAEVGQQWTKVRDDLILLIRDCHFEAIELFREYSKRCMDIAARYPAIAGPPDADSSECHRRTYELLLEDTIPAHQEYVSAITGLPVKQLVLSMEADAKPVQQQRRNLISVGAEHKVPDRAPRPPRHEAKHISSFQRDFDHDGDDDIDGGDTPDASPCASDTKPVTGKVRQESRKHSAPFTVTPDRDLESDDESEPATASAPASASKPDSRPSRPRRAATQAATPAPEPVQKPALVWTEDMLIKFLDMVWTINGHTHEDVGRPKRATSGKFAMISSDLREMYSKVPSGQSLFHKFLELCAITVKKFLGPDGPGYHGYDSNLMSAREHLTFTLLHASTINETRELGDKVIAAVNAYQERKALAMNATGAVAVAVVTPAAAPIVSTKRGRSPRTNQPAKPAKPVAANVAASARTRASGEREQMTRKSGRFSQGPPVSAATTTQENTAQEDDSGFPSEEFMEDDVDEVFEQSRVTCIDLTMDEDIADDSSVDEQPRKRRHHESSNLSDEDVWQMLEAARKEIKRLHEESVLQKRSYERLQAEMEALRRQLGH